MALEWPPKDPDDVLDYMIDWSKWLGSGDTIDTSTWIVPAGITKVSDSKSTKAATIWLSGGTPGTTVTLTNRITTIGGRTVDRSVTLTIMDK